jgi:hypothetical protein
MAGFDLAQKNGLPYVDTSAKCQPEMHVIEVLADGGALGLLGLVWLALHNPGRLALWGCTGVGIIWGWSVMRRHVWEKGWDRKPSDGGASSALCFASGSILFVTILLAVGQQHGSDAVKIWQQRFAHACLTDAGPYWPAFEDVFRRVQVLGHEDFSGYPTEPGGNRLPARTSETRRLLARVYAERTVARFLEGNTLWDDPLWQRFCRDGRIDLGLEIAQLDAAAEASPITETGFQPALQPLLGQAVELASVACGSRLNDGLRGQRSELGVFWMPALVLEAITCAVVAYTASRHVRFPRFREILN